MSRLIGLLVLGEAQKYRENENKHQSKDYVEKIEIK